MPKQSIVFKQSRYTLREIYREHTQLYLNLGLSTYFLNCFTLFNVCSASSLDGSTIKALGAFGRFFVCATWALPVIENNEKSYQFQLTTGNNAVLRIGGLMHYFQVLNFRNHSWWNFHSLKCPKCTCLLRFHNAILRSLIESNVAILRGKLKVFLTKVEF